MSTRRKGSGRIGRSGSFSESAHPRDANGKFTSKGSRPSPAVGQSMSKGGVVRAPSGAIYGKKVKPIGVAASAKLAREGVPPPRAKKVSVVGRVYGGNNATAGVRSHTQRAKIKKHR